MYPDRHICEDPDCFCIKKKYCDGTVFCSRIQTFVEDPTTKIYEKVKDKCVSGLSICFSRSRIRFLMNLEYGLKYRKMY